MHIIRDNLLDVPSGLSSMGIMATENKATNFQHPQFFIAQSENLTALLDVVVHEAETATNPDALVDYLELTSILSSLLEDARIFATLSEDDLQRSHQHVRKFLDKIQTVRDAVGDWGARTRVSMPTSRKRARSIDFEEATTFGLKRRRDSDVETVTSEGLSNIPVPSVLPSIETSPAPVAWWTEPFCD